VKIAALCRPTAAITRISSAAEVRGALRRGRPEGADDAPAGLTGSDETGQGRRRIDVDQVGPGDAAVREQQRVAGEDRGALQADGGDHKDQLVFGSLYTLGLSPRTSAAELILVIAAVGLQSAAISSGW
jgi:hypothetical protein